MVLTKIIFQNRYVALETGLNLPPLHGKCHLKFPFWLFEPLPYLQSIEYEDVHDPASKGIQGEGAVKFSIHFENDESFEE